MSTSATATTPLDPVDLLARPDKWFLGCGDGIIFAPPFPVWLDAPGFWDEGTIYQYAFAPLYTVSLLAEDGREVPLRAVRRRWTPSELTVEFEGDGGIQALETRSVHIGGVFVSEWKISSPHPRQLHLVAWTAQDAATVEQGSLAFERTLAFNRTLSDRREVRFRVRAELACASGPATSWAASLSERSAVHPHWRFTPFVEQWRGEGLPRRVRQEGISPDGLLYAAIHHALPSNVRESSAGFAMRLTPADADMRHGRGRHAGPRRPPGTPRDVAVAGAAPTPGSLGAASRRRWTELFAMAPHFRCSDPYFERYYWYRWYGLWLNAVDGGVGNFEGPTMCEGIGFFHQPITYSGQCHVRELRWLSDPAWAQGVLRSFFRLQKPNGSLHGRIYVNHLSGTDFYHANWGDALLALDAVWPNDEFVHELYPALARHSDWLTESRDADGTGMIDVVDQYETGQEYMSRYQAVDPRADAYGWENRIRLKGIDVTVYAYALAAALEQLATRAGHEQDAPKWRLRREQIADAMRQRMWDPSQGMFSDVNPESGERTNVAAAVCFYPYFTDVADASHVDGLVRNLLNPSRFWTQYPVPSSSLDDPLFNAEAEWKGKRHVCPWNGRVWPMTNSHVADAMGRWATTDRPDIRHGLVRLIHQFVRMMFHDGDLDRPNCFEHYNPHTGHASVYRGVDDYQHSWVVDLLIQYVAGLRPTAQGLLVDPLPFGLDLVELTGVRVRGRSVNVSVTGTTYVVDMDGERQERSLGDALLLDW